MGRSYAHSYEEAARALLFMERVGLQVDWLLYPRPVDDLALLLDALEDGQKGLSDIGAATWILGQLESRGLVTCAEQKRKKVLAVIGTVIANSCKVN